LEIVRFLVESGANKEAKKEYREETPLHLAAEQGHLEIVKFLVESGANKEEMDILNSTPQSLGHFDIVKFLDQIGAHREKNIESRAPLFLTKFLKQQSMEVYLKNDKFTNKKGI
jgi:ankyrin repeat protein